MPRPPRSPSMRLRAAKQFLRLKEMLDSSPVPQVAFIWFDHFSDEHDGMIQGTIDREHAMHTRPDSIVTIPEAQYRRS